MRRKHGGKRALPTHLISKRASPYGTFNVRINSLSHFNFPHSKFRNTVFSPTKKVQTFNGEKGGHCEYQGI